MNREIMARTSSDAFTCSEERIYKVDSSGACISAGYGVSLLHRYCSKLPHDEYAPIFAFDCHLCIKIFFTAMLDFFNLHKFC